MDDILHSRSSMAADKQGGADGVVHEMLWLLDYAGMESVRQAFVQRVNDLHDDSSPEAWQLLQI
eukprot:3853221-Lingulodinium_polyedra.AAC.1